MEKKSKVSISTITVLSVILLTLALTMSECVGDSSSTSTRTFNGIVHDKNNAGTMHAQPTTTPCAPTTTSCKNCHGVDLKGQTGWTSSSGGVYNPKSCTSCHNVKWNSDPNWNGTTCF